MFFFSSSDRKIQKKIIIFIMCSSSLVVLGYFFFSILFLQSCHAQEDWNRPQDQGVTFNAPGSQQGFSGGQSQHTPHQFPNSNENNKDQFNGGSNQFHGGNNQGNQEFVPQNNNQFHDGNNQGNQGFAPQRENQPQSGSSNGETPRPEEDRSLGLILSGVSGAMRGVGRYVMSGGMMGGGYGGYGPGYGGYGIGMVSPY